MQCHWEAGATSDGTQPEEGQGELAGNQGKPGGRGGPEASSLTGSLTRLPLSEAPSGKRPSQPLATALPSPGFEMCAPPLPPRLPSEFLHREARHGQAEGTQGPPLCPDCSERGVAAWFVLVHIQYQVGLEFSRGALLGVNMSHPGLHLSHQHNGGRYVFWWHKSHLVDQV